jgi:hypothetical protein
VGERMISLKSERRELSPASRCGCRLADGRLQHCYSSAGLHAAAPPAAACLLRVGQAQQGLACATWGWGHARGGVTGGDPPGAIQSRSTHHKKCAVRDVELSWAVGEAGSRVCTPKKKTVCTARDAVTSSQRHACATPTSHLPPRPHTHNPACAPCGPPAAALPHRFFIMAARPLRFA